MAMNTFIVLLACCVSTNSELGGVVFLDSGRLPDVQMSRLVYRFEPASCLLTPIYECDRSISGISYTPKAERILIAGYNKDLKFCLDIVSLQGALIERVDDAVSEVFLDEYGTEMAYTMGTQVHGEPIESQGTWIRNFSTGDREKVWDHGVWLESGSFDHALYIRDRKQGAEYHRYDLQRREIKDIDLTYGQFSPKGTYRWQYGSTGGVEIIRSDTGANISENSKILRAMRHGTPLYWMNDSILMLPHFMTELEDYVLFVVSGKTLKAPGRILSMSDDERFVFVCKPGLVVEKVAVESLEVLEEGKTD